MKSKGFTFIELFIVITLIAILAIIVFQALNPVKRFAQSRNERRFKDVGVVLNAIFDYQIDNSGNFPKDLIVGMPVMQIGSANSGCDTSCEVASASSCINLNSSLAKYLKTMPVDPSFGKSRTIRVTTLL
jgi:prepilin-type N-terminal cleavage/methylation domain-containing protein